MAPKLKRKCGSQESDGSDETTTNTLSKHCNCLYFNDGDVVLIAENTTFRVHKGLLALHSDVFRDMFDDDNEAEETEVSDGFSVVRLSDESSAMHTFLRALYMIEPISYADCQCGKYFIDILLLATKYACKTIRRQTLDVFRHRFYPDTLLAWDVRSTTLIPKHIIRLAHDIKAEILLPGAFYHLCRYGFDTSDLSRDDIITYVEGNRRIGAFWPEFLEHKLRNYKEPPCEHAYCSKPWRTFWKEKSLETLAKFKNPDMDPLSQFKSCSQDLAKVNYICLEAKQRIWKSCDEKRMKIWNELPEIFGRGSWEKLRDAADGFCDEYIESSPSPAVSSGDDSEE